MPRYVVEVLVRKGPLGLFGRERFYAVFSTVVMGFVSPLYRSLEELWRDFPELEGRRPLEALKGKLRGEAVAVRMKVYRLAAP